MKTREHKIEWLLVRVVLLCFFSFFQGTAQTVPANLQAALFKKIFSFDKALSAKATVDVVVIDGDDVAAAMKAAGINAASGSSAGGDVTYFGSAPAKAATAKAGILSISGTASHAEKGLVSIALTVEDGKPKIVVNMVQLKAEGHEISADLLKIAKVIQ
jgi:hypothetical protein